jgi:two-component system, chemotaxis family, protein-glutamate methylesterase/glutaminase
MTAEGRKIAVVVVEDSPTVREFLVFLLNSDPEIQVVGIACDGRQALEIVNREKPDIIAMDVNMPGMNGFQAAREIMQTRPTPIILVSGIEDCEEVGAVFRAKEAGALILMARPGNSDRPDDRIDAENLIRIVKAFAEVKVVKRWNRSPPERDISALPTGAGRPPEPIQVIAIGASTGGPMALRTVLSGLRKSWPVPIMLVQHMAEGFTEKFADWLSREAGLPVRLARRGEKIQPGHVYVAPDGFHLLIGPGGHIRLDDGGPVNGLRPSVARLFGSVADVYGHRALGVLLTGMGTDGAAELKRMNSLGAITIAQDAQSSIVHGMPGEAIRIGAASYVLSLAEIPAAMQRLLGGKP